MEKAVELFALVHFAVMGFSHLIAPRAWVRYFQWLREKGEPGIFVVAFMTLWFGSVIAAFHNVWTGPAAVLTFIGWAQVFKGALYFIFPQVGLKMIGRVTADRAHQFVWGGAVSLAIAAFLGWLWLR